MNRREHANWGWESLVALVDPVVRTPEPSVIKMELSTAATSWLDYHGEGYDVCVCALIAIGKCSWFAFLPCGKLVNKMEMSAMVKYGCLTITHS